MSRRRFITLSIALFTGLSSTAIAANISERVEMAQRRIEQGIRSRSLTREEGHRLIEEFRRVRHDEARARSDGRLDRRERERLNRELDRLDRHISRLKHNDNDTGGRRRP